MWLPDSCQAYSACSARRRARDLNLMANYTWSKTMDTGGLMVGNEVTVEIELETVAAKPAAPATN